MDRLAFVTYCGLYCALCAQRGRIPRQAQALRDAMRQEGYDFWGQELEGFPDFWAFLGALCDLNKACPGCRAGGGYPPCEIRQCARQRNVEVCPLCADYPCPRIQDFARTYPTLIADGQRLQAVGLDAWIAEQEQRASWGFIYADCRYNQA